MAKDKSESARLERAGAKAAKKGWEGAAFHFFFCGQSGCCDSPVEAKEAWKRLGRRARELEEVGVRLIRVEVECFSICAAGPLVAVYPGGFFYGRIDANAMDRLIDEHVLAGRPLLDKLIARPSITNANVSDPD